MFFKKAILIENGLILFLEPVLELALQSYFILYNVNVKFSLDIMFTGCMTDVWWIYNNIGYTVKPCIGLPSLGPPHNTCKQGVTTSWHYLTALWSWSGSPDQHQSSAQLFAVLHSSFITVFLLVYTGWFKALAHFLNILIGR